MATERGGPVTALWIVVAAVCVYLIAYRYYSKFIAEKVMNLDPKRATKTQAMHLPQVPQGDASRRS